MTGIKLSKKDFIIYFLLFLTGVFSRIPFVEKLQSHWDGPQYSIAIIRYSFSQETPAPPGYPLYIGLGKLFFIFTHDPHLALILISVIFSGIGASVAYIGGRLIYNWKVGLASSLIFLSGSVFYFFGLTAYGYIISPSMTLLLATFVFLIFVKKKQLGIPLGIIYALELGFRPQEVLFTLPLFLLGIYGLKKIEKIKSIFAFFISFLVWFIPSVVTSGGINEYLSYVLKSTSSGAIPKPSLLHAKEVFVIFLQGLYLSFGLSLGFLFFYIYKLTIVLKKKQLLTRVVKNKEFIFYFIWITPSLLFNLFIRSEHAGYQMTYITALLILIPYAICNIVKNNKLFLFTIIFAILAINLFVFFQDRDPQYMKPFRQTSFHYSDLRRNDYELHNKIDFIKLYFKPDNTIIVMDQVFWRQLMYYLPNYKIFVVDALMNNDPKTRNIRIDAYNWLRKPYIYSGNIFKLPPKTSHIILFDNGSDDWYQGQNKVVHKFKGIVELTIINVSNVKGFYYGYHKINLRY